MGSTVFPAPSAGGKTMYRTTLTSGTSYTVPAGVTYLNVTLVGGGGGACAGKYDTYAGFPYASTKGHGGQIVSTTLSVTAGASIAYAIGAGGAGGVNAAGSTGGTTTFTGATSATGGNGSAYYANTGNAGTSVFSAENGGGPAGSGGTPTGGAGGSGSIIVEYWA